jgi:cytochrome c oxidase subunit II
MPKHATDKRHFILVAVLVAISTALMYLLLKSALPLPVKASLEALAIDGLIDWHLVLIAFLFSLIVVFMLYSVVAFRRRPGDTSDGVHFEGNTALEIIWTVVPLLIVLVFAFYSVRVLADVTRTEPDELTVKVNGFQWSWSFEYATPDGRTFVSPELVLPNNQRVHMEMTSLDVIHSFWIPEMRVKQDLVPGHTTDVRFTPRIAGDYRLTCAEMCGLTHWNMVAAVRVMEPAEYEAWLADQTAALDATVAQADASSN